MRFSNSDHPDGQTHDAHIERDTVDEGTTSGEQSDPHAFPLGDRITSPGHRDTPANTDRSSRQTPEDLHPRSPATVPMPVERVPREAAESSGTKASPVKASSPGRPDQHGRDKAPNQPHRPELAVRPERQEGQDVPSRTNSHVSVLTSRTADPSHAPPADTPFRGRNERDHKILQEYKLLGIVRARFDITSSQSMKRQTVDVAQSLAQSTHAIKRFEKNSGGSETSNVASLALNYMKLAALNMLHTKGALVKDMRLGIMQRLLHQS